MELAREVPLDCACCCAAGGRHLSAAGDPCQAGDVALGNPSVAGDVPTARGHCSHVKNRAEMVLFIYICCSNTKLKTIKKNFAEGTLGA